MSEQQLKREIERIRKIIPECEEQSEKGILTAYGHWSLGFYQGKLAALEDWLFYMQKLKGGAE